jgi:hypothetical protein
LGGIKISNINGRLKFKYVVISKYYLSRISVPNLKRVSADLAGLANTNLLLVRWVRNGLIILLAARYHHGTLMNTCTR